MSKRIFSKNVSTSDHKLISLSSVNNWEGMGQEENGKENIKLRSTKSMMEELNQLTAFTQYKMFSENKKFSCCRQYYVSAIGSYCPGSTLVHGVICNANSVTRSHTLSHHSVTRAVSREWGWTLQFIKIQNILCKPSDIAQFSYRVQGLHKKESHFLEFSTTW